MGKEKKAATEIETRNYFSLSIVQSVEKYPIHM